MKLWKASKFMFNKENSKLAGHHGILALLIALLLGFILIVLVLKIGMMMTRGSKSHFSTCQVGSYQKNFIGHSGYMVGKFSNWKKSSYASYQEVVELTESGFIVKDGDGNEQVVVITEDTKIIKGKEDVENGVSVGDKVYVMGSLVEASMIKILDPDASEFKKLLK